MSRPLVIGYVLDDTLDVSDGVQSAVLTIGEHMRQLGHEVHYIVPTTTRSDVANIHVVGQSISLKFNGNSVRTPLPASTKKISRLFEEISFDVLHVQMPYSPLLAGRVIRRAPSTTTVVGTFHILPYSWVTKCSTRLLRVLVRRSLSRIDAAVAVSAPALTFMQSSLGIGGSVVPNPIDFQFFSRYRNDASSHKSKKKIVYLGRFDTRKGVMQLLKAFAEIPKEVRATTTLTMCGKGPLLAKAKAYAASQGIVADFPGFVDETQKARYLADADIAVFPSVSGESFGIVLAEAMAAGASITIGGNNPGYSSVLGRWSDALFDPNNVAAFRDRLVWLLTNPNEVRTIGSAQHAYVEEFDIRVVANTLLQQYTCKQQDKQG